MNLTQLKTFLAVSSSGNYSRAAEALRVTRPAVASCIKSLEARYGHKLFEQGERRIELSNLGQTLKPLAEQAIAVLDDIENSLSAAENLQHNFLAIGVGEPSLGISLISKYRDIYPGVRIQATEGNAHTLMKDLENRELDIAVLALTEPDPRFKNFLYCTDELFVCVPDEHEWAKRHSISFEEISQHTLILPGPHSTCRKIIENAFYRTRTTPKATIEFDEWDPILEATARGFGIGFLQGTFLTADPRVRPMSVEGVDMRVPQYIVCPSEYTELRTVQAFLEIAKDVKRKIEESS